jgi:hypothetical protein
MIVSLEREISLSIQNEEEGNFDHATLLGSLSIFRTESHTASTTPFLSLALSLIDLPIVDSQHQDLRRLGLKTQSSAKKIFYHYRSTVEPRRFTSSKVHNASQHAHRHRANHRPNINRGCSLARTPPVGYLASFSKWPWRQRGQCRRSLIHVQPHAFNGRSTVDPTSLIGQAWKETLFVSRVCETWVTGYQCGLRDPPYASLFDSCVVYLKRHSHRRANARSSQPQTNLQQTHQLCRQWKVIAISRSNLYAARIRCFKCFSDVPDLV